MRFVKPLIGVFLILVAAGGLIYWEIQGRQMIMQEQVAVAARPVMPGEKVSNEMFSIVSVDHSSVMDGALDSKNIKSLEGKSVKQYIPQNAQISAAYFTNDNIELPEGNSIFMLKPTWIDGRSSSLRKGDRIEIYDDFGEYYFGSFKVAFVKDDAEMEVTSTVHGENNGLILERTDSAGSVSCIEIITTVQKYGEIVRFIEETGKGLLIVQSGDSV